MKSKTIPFPGANVPGRASGPHAKHVAGRALRPFAAGVLALAGITLLSGGCATTGSPGERLVHEKLYAEAVPVLQREREQRPDDFRILRSLGIALIESGEAGQAVEVLRRARELAPKDPHSAFQLGRACEQAGDPGGAIGAYGDYLGLGGKGRAEIGARLRDLSLKQARQEISAALAREESIKLADIPENAVTVPDFANVARSDTLAPLSRGLAAMVITDLQAVEALRVLERQRLQILLGELGLAQASPVPAAVSPRPQWRAIETVEGIQERLKTLTRAGGTRPYYEGAVDGVAGMAYQEAVRAFQADHGLTADGIPGPRTRAKLEAVLAESGGSPGGAPAAVARAAVDPKTAPRLGKILGARRLVQGAFVPLGESGIQLDATLVDVRGGGQLPAGEPVQGPLKTVLQLEKDLVYQILGTLGISPTPAERREIDRLPTENLMAFLAYSRGLELDDRGMHEAAAEAYGEALRLDPGFDVAHVSADIALVAPADQQQLDQREAESGAQPAEGSGDRLVRTAEWNGVGPGPDAGVAEEGDPSFTPAEIGVTNAQIIIEGDLPRGDAP